MCCKFGERHESLYSRYMELKGGQLCEESIKKVLGFSTSLEEGMNLYKIFSASKHTVLSATI